MKRSIIAVALLLATGCAAVVTPEGTYLEPLPFAVTVAPSVAVVAPAPVLVERVRPLPPVYVVQDRYIYTYGGLYYYYWGGAWYYGPERGGPWHALPRQYYPPSVHRGGPGRVPPGQMKKW